MVLPTLSVSLLGGFRVNHGQNVLTDRFHPRLQAFVAYLLLHRHTPLSRQHIAFSFWPESDDAQARANMRKSIYRLRQTFPEVDDYLDLGGTTLYWRDSIPLQLDVAAFESALQAAAGQDTSRRLQSLQVALTLYKGHLLPDLYDDWVLAARERLRLQYIAALQTVAELHEQRDDYAAAIVLVRRLIDEEPLVEKAYRSLMRLQARSGDLAGALRTYHQCARQLAQELGVDPGRDTQESYRRLLERRKPAEAPPAPYAPLRTPLVGRDAAWQQLLAAWRAAAGGQQQAVIINGDVGAGKTHLAEALLKWIQRQGIVTLTAACFPTETPLPLRPIGDWLRAPAVARTLHDLAPRWQSEVARILPELLVTHPALPMPQSMTEAWQQQHLFTALVEAFRAVGKPQLLFIDDMQWADADTFRWLHYLARQKTAYPFLLLATVRSGEVAPAHPLPAWQQEMARLLPVRTITLQPLNIAETTMLASQLLGEALDEATAAALYAETEGNPLFTVEMIRAGFPQQKAPLPEKVRSVIELRLNRLTTEARELAGLAAVVGRSFTFATLAAASPQSEEDVLASLDELWQQQIIREQSGDGYDFSHDKIRQVALLQLSPTRRRWWHGRVALALEQLPDEKLHDARAQIAAHWQAAGHPQKAVAHYLQAARAASHLYAHQEVTDYLQRALPSLTGDDAQRSEIHLLLGDAWLALGHYKEAAAHFQEAATSGDDITKKVDVHARQMVALSHERQFSEARDVFDNAVKLLPAAPFAEDEGDLARTWIELHLSLLNTLYFANEQEEMARVCTAMAGPIEQFGTAHQRAQYLTAVSRMRCRLLRYRMTDEDVAERRAALQWALETADDSLIAEQQFGLGFILLWAGYALAASDELREATERAEALGYVPLQSRCLTYLGIACRMMGDEAGVRQTVEKLAPLARSEGNRIYIGVSEALRAWLCYRAADNMGAERRSRAALRRWRAASDPPYPMQWLARLLLVAVMVEDEATAARQIPAREQAEALLVPSQQRLPDALAHALEAVVETDDPTTFRKQLQLSCRLAREHGYL